MNSCGHMKMKPKAYTPETYSDITNTYPTYCIEFVEYIELHILNKVLK